MTRDVPIEMTTESFEEREYRESLEYYQWVEMRSHCGRLLKVKESRPQRRGIKKRICRRIDREI